MATRLERFLQDLVEHGIMKRKRVLRGNGEESWELSTDDANGVREGEAVGILVDFECGFVHEATNGEMSHHEPIELLANQIGRLAAQDDVGAA
jgi:hypothetical protein